MESESASAVALPGRILVVEDDRQIRAIISLLLEDEGYEIETASDGKQALAQLHDGPPPDLIILDLMLPSLDGWEFRTIQRADPTLAAIPVLAVSADASPKAAAIDATSFLRKPFGAEDLIDRVRGIIRERVRMEARLAETQRLIALGRLAAEATHELSSPLGSVVANVSTIEHLTGRIKGIVEEFPADQAHPREAALVGEGRSTVTEMQDTLRDIRIGTDRMVRSLNDLRAGSRRDREPFGPVDLQAVLESAIAVAAHEIRPRARLIFDCDHPPPVRGNEARLGQLFTNLLINAAHAIDGGPASANHIRITVKAGPHHLTVEVRDTGHGMTREVCARMFEPFFTTKSPQMGTGLGLAICQAIVREHVGRIEVESEPGRGSLFRVILPLDRAQTAAEETRPSRRRFPARSPIRIGPGALRIAPVSSGPGPRRPG